MQGNVRKGTANKQWSNHVSNIVVKMYIYLKPILLVLDRVGKSWNPCQVLLLSRAPFERFPLTLCSDLPLPKTRLNKYHLNRDAMCIAIGIFVSCACFFQICRILYHVATHVFDSFNKDQSLLLCFVVQGDWSCICPHSCSFL